MFVRRQLVAVSGNHFQIGQRSMKSTQFRLKLVEMSKSVNRFVIVADGGQGMHVFLDLADDLRIKSPFEKRFLVSCQR